MSRFSFSVNWASVAAAAAACLQTFVKTLSSDGEVVVKPSQTSDQEKSLFPFSFSSYGLQNGL